MVEHNVCMVEWYPLCLWYLAGWNEDRHHGDREEHREEAARDWQGSITGDFTGLVTVLFVHCSSMYS